MRWVEQRPLSPGRRFAGQLASGIAVSSCRTCGIRDCGGNGRCPRDVRPVGSVVAEPAYAMRTPTFFSATLKTLGIIENVFWTMTSSDGGGRSKTSPRRVNDSNRPMSLREPDAKTPDSCDERTLFPTSNDKARAEPRAGTTTRTQGECGRVAGKQKIAGKNSPRFELFKVVFD